MKYEGDNDANCNWCTWKNPLRIGKGIGRFGNKSTNGDHLGYSITKIGQNTEESPRDLKRIVITQTLVRNHWLMLV